MLSGEFRWNDKIVESAKSAHEWLRKVYARGHEFARNLLAKLDPPRYMALMATLSEVETGDETQSEAWLSALTSKLTSPNLPLSSFDKGRVDGIVTSLGHKHSFLSLLLPNLFEVFGWGDANNGNQEVKLAPKQMVETKVSVVLSLNVFFSGQVCCSLGHDARSGKGLFAQASPLCSWRLERVQSVCGRSHWNSSAQWNNHSFVQRRICAAKWATQSEKGALD